MSKPRVAKVPQTNGTAVWCVITPAYGFSFSALRHVKCGSWREALAKASKLSGGGTTYIESAPTPEHGPDYFGLPARYWPGVYR